MRRTSRSRLPRRAAPDRTALLHERCGTRFPPGRRRLNDVADGVADEIASVIAGEPDFIANLANTSAVLHQRLGRVNWTGFYLLRDGVLVLGPFQGRPACVRIPLGRGVCGTAAGRRETIIVPDVHEFPGHIACDAESRSEIVVPLLRSGVLLGVLDVDSPERARFGEEERALLERVATLLVAGTRAVAFR